MRRFNPERELNKIQHGNRNKIIAFVFLLLVVSVVSYSFALYQVRYSKRIIYTKVAPSSNRDIDLAVYLDKSPIENFPTKDSGNLFDYIECDNNEDNHVISNWNKDKWALSLEVTNKAKCNVYFRTLRKNEVVGEFPYNGNIQEFHVLVDGYYKLEVWGAQGGIRNTSNAIGGKGGYSVGAVRLTAGTTLYVVVGGQPTTNSMTGGYNGGGNGKSDTNGYGAGGGGATHIASVTGTLVTIGVDNKSKIYIVAGGGGGGSYGNVSGNGGAGGGISGLSSTEGISGWIGSGGTQLAAGSNQENPQATIGAFGKGGNCTYGWGAGGGGGLYGGGASVYTGAGGGSGYIDGVTNYEEIVAITLAGNTEFPNTAGTTNETGHEGNGYAKITYLGNI